MFALMVGVHYEGEDLLGIYSTLARAVEAARAYMAADAYWGDYIEITEMAIDADTSSRFHRSPCWTETRDRA